MNYVNEGDSQKFSFVDDSQYMVIMCKSDIGSSGIVKYIILGVAINNHTLFPAHN